MFGPLLFWHAIGCIAVVAESSCLQATVDTGTIEHLLGTMADDLKCGHDGGPTIPEQS